MLTAQHKAEAPDQPRLAALVFTQRQACAFVLNELLLRLLTCSRFLPADVLMEETRMLVKEQQDKVLALFRRGASNLLFTTAVTEEGLDVQHCSLVVCYDVPTRPLSLVQTVGRARARNAEVVFMDKVVAAGYGSLHPDRVKLMNSYMQQIRGMVIVCDALASRSPAAQRVVQHTDPDTLRLAQVLAAGDGTLRGPQPVETYIVLSTKASVTPHQALALLHRYCECLMSRRALVKIGWDCKAAQTAVADLTHGTATSLGADLHTLRARFLTDRLASADGRRLLYRCTIFLPRCSPVSEVCGRAAPNVRTAHESAAMLAVQTLHGRGELDDYLWPRLDTCISEFAAAVDSEDWLVTRVAGDRIEEGNWCTLQTWRKPPQMRLAQNTPLTLDIRMADARCDMAAGGLGRGSSADAQSAGAPAMCSKGQAAAADRKTFWLYSLQMVASKILPDSATTHRDDLALGTLLQSALPDLHGFPIHLDHAGADSAATCHLVSGGALQLANEEVGRLQVYHCALLSIKFRAAGNNGGRLADVSMAVVNAEVKVSITPRRIVRRLGSHAVEDAVRQLLDVVMVEYWNSEAPASKGAQQDHSREQAEDDKSFKAAQPGEWCKSSAGAWYIIVPVTVKPTVGGGGGEATAEGVDGSSGDVDVKPKSTAFDVSIVWETVRALCDVGIQPIDKFTAGSLSKLADVGVSLEERLAAQAAASAALEDRIIIANYGRARQPYMFFSFVPGSSILQAWPHRKARQQTLEERREAKRRKRQAKEDAAVRVEMPAARLQGAPVADPTRVWKHEEAARDKRRRQEARLRARALAEAQAAGGAVVALLDAQAAEMAVARQHGSKESAVGGETAATVPVRNPEPSAVSAQMPMQTTPAATAARVVLDDAPTPVAADDTSASPPPRRCCSSCLCGRQCRRH
eukprot:jgi/Ulvmu1/10477/UM064_0014.1